MSDHIPFEIQIEIMKRFPVKSLMRFRNVSKQWKSLIDSSRFVSDYGLRQTQPHLFIVYEDIHEIYLMRYVSIVDDDSFPDNFSEKICDVSAILPNSIKQFPPTFVGSSQGLLCFLGFSRAVIWNPCIRKSVEFTTSALNFDFRPVFGFGVCPKTSDPKIVKITYREKQLEMQTWTIDVFSFKTRSCRSRSFSKISNLHCKSLELLRKLSSRTNECANGFIYWCAFNKDDSVWVVISFDLTNEEFGVIHLPNSFARYKYMDLSKYRESLVLIPNDPNISFHDYDVWMMEGNVTKSFKKLFTINSPHDLVTQVAISYNGVGIMDLLENDFLNNVSSIDTYEPILKRFKYTTITGHHGSSEMSFYKETMLLHNYKEFNV